MSKDVDPFGSFNLSDFKKWIKNHSDNKEKESVIGTKVESKISLANLLQRIQTDEIEQEIAEDFKENGGTIMETHGHEFLIEVNSGSFIIHRMYVKKSSSVPWFSFLVKFVD